MTKFQKQMLTIAAAGALTAVTALPAMAFENEFHGSFIFNTVVSNFENGGSGNFAPATNNAKTKSANYIEQRARLQYIGKASDDLKMVTHFEIDNRYGLAKGFGTSGTTIDTDTYNVEVKHAYLDFNVGKSLNVKLGMQPYKDTLKGIFIDADVAAAVATVKLDKYTLGMGFSRLAETANNTPLGSLSQDLYILDNTFAFSKDTKAAFSYYLLADYRGAGNRDMLHTFGLSGETKVGPVSLSGFVAKQVGDTRTVAGGARSSYHGWAANVNASAKIGSGTANTGFLFVSGDNNAAAGHNTGWGKTEVQSYNTSGSMILIRDTRNSPTTTDLYIRRVISNIAVANLGYDAKLTDKLGLDTNVLFAWAPSSQDAPVDRTNGGQNGGDFMGTELNTQVSYQIYKNLSLRAQAAYMMLGGYYKNSARTISGGNDTPDNPYVMRLQARYAF